MNEIWANRLIAGTKTWDEMPLMRQIPVKKILLKRVKDEVITEEHYLKIIGESKSESEK